MSALKFFRRDLSLFLSALEDCQPAPSTYFILKMTLVLRPNSAAKHTTPELSLPEMVRHAMRRSGDAQDDFEGRFVFTVAAFDTPMKMRFVDAAHLANSRHEPWKIFDVRPLVINSSDGRIHDDGLFDRFHI
jgi:hypothetical protein